MQNKIKITQQEFDDIYDIENPQDTPSFKEITGDTGASAGKDKETPPADSQKQDTTPLLTEEEQELEDVYLEGYDIPDGAEIG